MDNIDQLSARLIEIRDERRELRSRDSDLADEFDQITQQVLVLMENMGCESTRTQHATLTISRQTVPSVTDWDAFYHYLKKQDALWMLQRRISADKWREQRVLEPSGEIPGTEPFEKVGVKVRKK